ncbi:DUF4232 domain-containing protein [Arthrobacter sp. MDT2-16]
MTSLLGSKRWIMAAAAAGTLMVASGCASSGTDGGGAAAPSSSSASPSVSSSASPSSSASSSASGSATGTTEPSASPSSGPSGPAEPSASASTSASASADPTPSAAPTPAAGGTCTAAQLTGSVEDQLGGAGAGSVSRTIVLTNASDQECTVDGFPGVSFVDASGAQIGAPADRDGSASVPVTLAPGASSTTTVRQTNAQNYGADCGLTPAVGLRVYPPGATDSLVLPQQLPACSATSVVLMTVGTLQPAS